MKPEGLAQVLRRQVDVILHVDQLELRPQQHGKACRVVPKDGKGAATFRPAGPKTANDSRAARPQRRTQRRRVGRLTRRRRQEMQDGAIMPQVKASRRNPVCHVRDNPFDFAGGFIADAGLRVRESDRGNIDHCKIGEPLRQEPIDENRRAAADIQHGLAQRNAGPFDQRQRHGWNCLTPTHGLRRFVRVNTVPMIFSARSHR